MERKTCLGACRRLKTTKKRSLKGAPKNVKDVYWRPQESGFDTMLNILLNILLRAEEREREESEWKHIMDYIVLSSFIRMDTRASLYRRERGALASNLTNVGTSPTYTLTSPLKLNVSKH